MTVRDTPTCHLAANSVVCLGLSLPEGLSASVNRPRLAVLLYSTDAVFQLVHGHVH